MAGTGGDSAPPFEGAEPRDAAAGWLAGGEWRGTEERRRRRAPVRWTAVRRMAGLLF